LEKEKNEMQNYTLSILVDNKYGALTRIAGLFARRAYNIDSLTVGETQVSGLSRITLVTTADERIIQTIAKQVEKIADVRAVEIMVAGESVKYELMLVKVKDIKGLEEVVDENSAKVVDVTDGYAIVAIMGAGERLRNFLELIKKFEIVEMSRTGVTALERGSSTL
jgi:acetolactate synthase-1/3 small subunit